MADFGAQPAGVGAGAGREANKGVETGRRRGANNLQIPLNRKTNQLMFRVAKAEKTDPLDTTRRRTRPRRFVLLHRALSSYACDAQEPEELTLLSRVSDQDYEDGAAASQRATRTAPEGDHPEDEKNLE
jgi:hypothetical protein